MPMAPPSDDSIFFDEWQACLRSHYIYVIRADDQITEPSLRRVLLQTGLNEDDLEALRDEALSLGPLPPDATPDAADVDEPARALPGDDTRDGDEDAESEGDEDGDDFDLPEDDGGQLALF